MNKPYRVVVVELCGPFSRRPFRVVSRRPYTLGGNAWRAFWRIESALQGEGWSTESSGSERDGSQLWTTFRRGDTYRTVHIIGPRGGLLAPIDEPPMPREGASARSADEVSA